MSMLGTRERNVILLDQDLWPFWKVCRFLLAYCLLEGPWALIFFLLFSLSLSFFSFFFKWAPSTSNSTIGHVSIFSTHVGIFVPLILLWTLVLLPLVSLFFSNQNFALSHASNAIILQKSESFICLKQKVLDLWSMIILSTKTTRINNGLNNAIAHSFNIYILDSRYYVKQDLIFFF